MKPPAFWFSDPRHPALMARVLAPLGWVYGAVTAQRLRSGASVRAAVPVICVGNINVGGTGKTPAVIALLQLLSSAGYAPHVVTRGYGGSLAGPVLVSERAHKADETGDEPLLIAAFAPTWVARDRAAGVQSAVAAGADVVVMDDGFQNPSVVKDLSIVVVDAAQGFGNGRVMPAGPLRETVPAGLARAGLVLSIGGAAAQNTFTATWGHALQGVPHIRARIEPLQTGMTWAGMPVLAFAGIGQPEKFFDTLRGLGANLVRTVALDDHQPLSASLLARMDQDAKHLGAQLVTTEKDAVRLPGPFRPRVLTLPVRLVIEDTGAMAAALARIGLGPR
jgi:tetraacyldisaccharide 4'-kinase